MKIHSANWNQKQFVDQGSAAPDNNSEGWRKVSFKQGKTCQIEGRNFQVIGKMERHLPISSGGRIGGIALGILLSIGTLGLAPLFSKKVRQLFTGRQVQVVVKEILQHKGAQPQLDPNANKAAAGGNKINATPKKASNQPVIVTADNATDSSRFVKGDHSTANWEKHQGDIAFALNCCDYPKLAAYIANKHGKNIHQTCSLINAFEVTHPGVTELTAQDILPLFGP